MPAATTSRCSRDRQLRLAPRERQGRRAGTLHAHERSPVLKTVFTQEDDAILEWNEDDGQRIEPVCFYSVIAVVLANTQRGVGVGSNCSIPCHDPRELLRRHRLFCEAVKRQRAGTAGRGPKAPGPLLPWARYYRGSITLEDGVVIDRGVFTPERRHDHGHGGAPALLVRRLRARAQGDAQERARWPEGQGREAREEGGEGRASRRRRSRRARRRSTRPKRKRQRGSRTAPHLRRPCLDVY